MRGRMSDAESYADPVEVGDVMVGGTVCEVDRVALAGRTSGELVLSYSGWQTHAVARRPRDAQARPRRGAGLDGPGGAGHARLHGVRRAARDRQAAPGETVVVAAATGPVGSAVGQIAKIKGARAVGIAGGAEKCRALLEEFGFDAAVDHRAPDFRERLADAVPDGIDVYFENVGGAGRPRGAAAPEPLRPDAGLRPGRGLQRHRRGRGAGPAATAFMRRVLTKSLTVRGFIQGEFAKTRTRDFLEEMSAWVTDGQVRYREDVTVGLDARRGVRRDAGRAQLRQGAGPGLRGPDPVAAAKPPSDLGVGRVVVDVRAAVVAINDTAMIVITAQPRTAQAIE